MKPLPPGSTPFSRREFVSLVGAAAAAVPLAGLARAQSTTPNTTTVGVGSPAPAGSTIHVFAKPIQWASYDETAALVAEAGYGGIDFAVRPGGHVVPEKVQDDLPKAVAAAKKAGLKVEMITTAITNVQDKHTEPLLRTAAQLGIKVYRLGNLPYDDKLGVWGSLQKHKVAMRELAALNKSLGLHGAVQNHAGVRVGGPIWDLYELLRDLDPQWAGVQYDIRHAVAEGGQSWPLALKLLAPWIRCTDLKDFRWEQSPGKAVIENTPIGEGIVPFDAYFKLVRELNIRGPISVHFEYPPFEKFTRQVTKEEKRALFLAAMKKDLDVITTHRKKHGLA